MKKLFKCLSAFAIAGMISINSVNAQDITCEEGQQVHTNYYIFMDMSLVSSINEGIQKVEESNATNGKSDIYTRYTGADKYNSLDGKNPPAQGNLPIKNGSSTTASNLKEEGWTVEEFWKRYYEARLAHSLDNNKVYTNNTTHESYFFHQKWYEYDGPDFTSSQAKEYNPDNSKYAAAVKKMIEDAGNNLASSDLVTKGTYLPTTNIHTATTFEGLTDPAIRMHATRTYDKQLTGMGIEIDGKTYVYSPAVYYVKYCEGKTSTKKTITYDKNTDDTVDNMPANKDFSDKCLNLDSKRPTRAGYQFLGWSKDGSSTSAEYSPNQELCSDKSVTLFAIWKKVESNPDGSVTVKYNANGGKDAPSDQTIGAGKCENLSTAKPTRANFTFLGWSPNQNAVDKDSTYDPGSQYCATSGNITLYAVWSPKTGISAHFIAFGAVAVAAVAAFIVAKKKDLFKQI